jgi:hypothetical protein
LSRTAAVGNVPRKPWIFCAKPDSARFTICTVESLHGPPRWIQVFRDINFVELRILVLRRKAVYSQMIPLIRDIYSIRNPGGNLGRNKNNRQQ